MDSYEIIYHNSLDQIEPLLANEIGQINESVDFDTIFDKEIASDLDGWDYCFAVLFGLAGLLIASSKKLDEYLEDIHKSASGVSGDYDRFQNMLGKLFHHKNDTIDQIDGHFINREGENAYAIFHRLFWGHDIFSISIDNPFYLMIKQNGCLSGILQVVRHLLADTMSRQGLPVQGSSFLDSINPAGKITNHLIEVAKKLSEESSIKIQAERVYAHMFTIRAQDIAAGVIVKLFSSAYFLARGLKDETRISQFQLIAYSVNFFGEAVYGCKKQGGIPYINLPLASQMITSLGRLYYANYKSIRELQDKTNELARIDNNILASSQRNSRELPSYSRAEEYCLELINGQQNVDDLLEFFGKEE